MSPATLDDLLVRYGDARVAAAKAASDQQAIPYLAEAGRLRRAHRVATVAGNAAGHGLPDVERIPSLRPPLADHVHDDRCARQTGVSGDIYLCGYRQALKRGGQR